MKEIKWLRLKSLLVSPEWPLSDRYIQFEINRIFLNGKKLYRMEVYKSTGSPDTLYFKKLSSAKTVANLLRNG